MNTLEFYAEAHWGSRYGVIDAFHPTRHKGLDCGLFHGTIDVPALHSGKVVAAAPSSIVGHYVTVERADGLFDTYCHIVPGVSDGESVVQGQRLGRQAVTPTEGGSAWRGQHTHLCLSRTRDGWGIWGSSNLDPTPGVIALLTHAAGAGADSPIDPTEPQEEGTMKPNQIHWTDAKNTIQHAMFVPGTGYWLQWTEGGTFPTATALAQQQDHPVDSAPVTESMANAVKAAADAMLTGKR